MDFKAQRRAIEAEVINKDSKFRPRSQQIRSALNSWGKHGTHESAYQKYHGRVQGKGQRGRAAVSGRNPGIHCHQPDLLNYPQKSWSPRFMIIGSWMSRFWRKRGNMSSIPEIPMKPSSIPGRPFRFITTIIRTGSMSWYLSCFWPTLIFFRTTCFFRHTWGWWFYRPGVVGQARHCQTANRKKQMGGLQSSNFPGAWITLSAISIDCPKFTVHGFAAIRPGWIIILMYFFRILKKLKSENSSRKLKPITPVANYIGDLGEQTFFSDVSRKISRVWSTFHQKQEQRFATGCRCASVPDGSFGFH